MRLSLICLTFLLSRWVKFDPWGHHLYTGILNSSSVPPEESNQGQVSYINGPTELYNIEERQRLRERYRHLVQQITTHQRDRSGTQPPPGPAYGYPGTGVVPVSGLHDISADDHPVPSTSHIAGMLKAQTWITQRNHVKISGRKLSASH